MKDSYWIDEIKECMKHGNKTKRKVLLMRINKYHSWGKIMNFVIDAICELDIEEKK